MGSVPSQFGATTPWFSTVLHVVIKNSKKQISFLVGCKSIKTYLKGSNPLIKLNYSLPILDCSVLIYHRGFSERRHGPRTRTTQPIFVNLKDGLVLKLRK